MQPIRDNPLLGVVKQKYQRLCGWSRRGFPGSHPVPMDRHNYEMIVQSPYMVTWKSVGKQYMMLIQDEDEVYMLDQGDHAFIVNHIQFPCDAEYKSHLKDTLVDGELVIDQVDGLEKPSYLINDIFTYNGRNVSAKPFRYRLRLISEWIINTRNKAMTKGHITKTKQPFSVRSKDIFGLSEVYKLLSPTFVETLPHGVEGFIFLPENNPYTSGECRHVLKWKENATIEFLLRIVDHSMTNEPPKKVAQLFLNHKSTPFDTIPYSPSLEAYDNKVISCSYKDGQWKFHRLRVDRPFANSVQSAQAWMDAIKKPITIEVLCHLIKNRSQKDIHGNASSSTI